MFSLVWLSEDLRSGCYCAQVFENMFTSLTQPFDCSLGRFCGLTETVSGRGQREVGILMRFHCLCESGGCSQ